MGARSRLRRYLTEENLSQDALAEKLGVVPATVSMLLSDRYPDRVPSLRVAQELERITGGLVRHDEWIRTTPHKSEAAKRGRNRRSGAIPLRNSSNRG
jgi:transcriptional regulator with XRE-family HTH domain